MSTIQRHFLLFLLGGQLLFAQAPGSKAMASSDTPSSSAQANLPSSPGVLLAANALAAQMAPTATAETAFLLHPPLVAPVPEKRRVSDRQRHIWYGLMAAEHGAAVLDAWSTRQSIRSGNRELDPLVRPFVHSSALYPALQVAPLVVDYMALKMMRSNRSTLRKLWWVPQLIATAGSVACGISNLNVTK